MAEVYGREEWIIDGNYHATMEERLERAEVVVYLDFARWRCLWGAAKRLVTQWGRVRSDMAQGCSESPDWEFYQWIWNFRRDVHPDTMELVSKFPHLKVHLPKTRREVEEVIEGLVGG
jgi:adenylate kinase family enzyme